MATRSVRSSRSSRPCSRPEPAAHSAASGPRVSPLGFARGGEGRIDRTDHAAGREGDGHVSVEFLSEAALDQPRAEAPAARLPPPADRPPPSRPPATACRPERATSSTMIVRRDRSRCIMRRILPRWSGVPGGATAMAGPPGRAGTGGHPVRSLSQVFVSSAGRCDEPPRTTSRRKAPPQFSRVRTS